MRALCLRLLLAGTCALVTTAHAQRSALPASLVVETLGVEKPTAFSPVDFDTRDFALDTLHNDGAGVEVHLVPQSLRWVRVAHWSLVPRALLIVRAHGVTAGVVDYAGFTQPLVVRGGEASAEVPVALLAGAAYPIQVRVVRGGVTHDASFAVRFAPRPAQRGRVLFDSSCSPYALRVQAGAIPPDSWLYVGCRLIRSARETTTAATLELYALWDHAGPSVRIGGLPSTPAIDTLYTYRVGFEPGHVKLDTRAHAVTLAYALPDRVPYAFVGLGLGPYAYSYQDAGTTDVSTTIPLITLYAGYSFMSTARIVYFNATALNRNGSIDQGLYIWFEQLRMIDDRVSLNLLLGANVLIYKHDGAVTGRVSIPQGFELVTRDVFARNHNLTLGAFIYPKIADRSYYNAWIRWGTPQFFAELNYIAWQEPHDDGNTQSRALGVSVGMPLLRLF